MLVYRIALVKYAGSLKASGRAARWNPNDTAVIYTSSCRSLACLENIVHRSQSGLNQLFSVMTIEIKKRVEIEVIKPLDLPPDWKEYHQMQITQTLGSEWISENRTAVLQVPSSIIDGEVNYLLNPLHPDFKFIHLLKTEPFVFDGRIKL